MSDTIPFSGTEEKQVHIDMPITPSEVDKIPPIIHSLITVLNRYGKDFSPYTLMGGRTSGISVAQAVRFVRKAGFDCTIIRRDAIEAISQLVLPCVLLLQNDESCVLLSHNEGKCAIVLPVSEQQETLVACEDLEQEYIGYAIFISKQTKQDRRVSSVKLINEKRWFWDVIFYYMPIYKHVIVASILINVIAIASSLFSMNVYDRVVPNHAIATAWALAFGLAIAYFCDFILKNLRSYFVDIAGRNADVILSSKLVEKVLSLGFKNKPESTGVLANNIREFESLREFFSSSTLLAVLDVPFLFLFLALTAYIGGSIVYIPLMAVPVMVLVGFVLQKYSERHVEQGFKQNMQKNALLVEIINGLETIKCCSAEQSMQQNWDSVVGASAYASHSSRTVNSLITSTTAVITQFVALAVIMWGVYLISDRALTMGGLIACTILVGRAMVPLMQVSALLTRFQQSRMTLKALDMLMQLPSENAEETISLDTEHFVPDIRFENVSFAYPNASKLSLENINLTLKYGERVGIIGRMGSGKSTLAKLIAGLYEPSEGSVNFGDIDIRQIDMGDLRAHMGFLPQDIVLFYGSVRDNIALNDSYATDRLVLRAAQLAGVTEFVKKNPAGLAASVGERGMNFSGGQRQAIALARAMLHEPEVVILDEPSSNMDTLSEAELKGRIKNIIGSSTLVIITHRFSMLDAVDRLIVMNDGKIYADGPKDEILKSMQSYIP